MYVRIRYIREGKTKNIHPTYLQSFSHQNEPVAINPPIVLPAIRVAINFYANFSYINSYNIEAPIFIIAKEPKPIKNSPIHATIIELLADKIILPISWLKREYNIDSLSLMYLAETVITAIPSVIPIFEIALIKPTL